MILLKYLGAKQNAQEMRTVQNQVVIHHFHCGLLEKTKHGSEVMVKWRDMKDTINGPLSNPTTDSDRLTTIARGSEGTPPVLSPAEQEEVDGNNQNIDDPKVTGNGLSWLDCGPPDLTGLENS
ncbi:hypothetical protein Hypma_005931 [Hypsizygus marmoreus]|uniref:Uncharacterized protein n=1 Tax=Hypsizygus marmoreus TaxID=39966 RepID=A0A369KFW8_HYPMA|nr:hypothetical protein Hypma_005931 [Hypsizygus marmoreus]